MRKGDQYLASSIHHKTWTRRLSQAALWVGEGVNGATLAASTRGGELVTIELKEIQ